MNLRYTLSFLSIMKIPGLYPVLKDWQAFVRMNFLFAAYECGLLNALVTPCKKSMLIKELDVKRPELLDALLDVGLATKELELKDEIFRVIGKRSKAILASNGDMLAAMIQANVTYYNDVYRNAAQRIHGSELGEDLREIGDLVARFSKIAEPIMKEFTSSIARGKNPMRLLDVGCGSGIMLKSAHEANSNATGIGLDIDEAVVRQARENLSTWGISNQFEILHGDIRHVSGEFARPFDIITLYNLLYYFDKEERLNLIEKLRDMLSPLGVLAVAMSFHSEGKDMASANLNMVNCSLKGLTPLPHIDDITSLLKRCGFGRIKFHRFIPGSTFYGIVALKN
jgi:cyclopropane fatty-acyl-phospholipid synthase-like methyltransferase